MELQGLGRYRLADEFSGPSPYARYFLARHEDDDDSGGHVRYVAKLLAPGFSGDNELRRGQFDHEARLLSSFNHACIPSLHASGDQDGIAYMVLDRVDGVSLATLLAHDGEPRGLTKEVAVYVMGQLVDALRHVHSLEYLDGDEPTPLGLVHRDLCPSNVWVSTQGDVLLYDFMQAHSRWLPAKHDDSAAGALAYKAPERLSADGGANEKTDLFGMATILWECLRGERLFAGEDDAATRGAIERFDISQPSRRVSGLSPKLSEIVRKNLDRDPGRRYTGAYQMLQRLAQAPEAKVAEQSRQNLARLVSEALATPGAAKS